MVRNYEAVFLSPGTSRLSPDPCSPRSRRRRPPLPLQFNQWVRSYTAWRAAPKGGEGLQGKCCALQLRTGSCRLSGGIWRSGCLNLGRGAGWGAGERLGGLCGSLWEPKPCELEVWAGWGLHNTCRAVLLCHAESTARHHHAGGWGATSWPLPTRQPSSCPSQRQSIQSRVEGLRHKVSLLLKAKEGTPGVSCCDLGQVLCYFQLPQCNSLGQP